MEFTINKNDFSKAIARVSGAIDRKAPMDVLKNIHLAADKKNGLTLSATDLAIGITTSTGADVTTQGAVCLPGKTLLDLVKALPKDEVRITVDGSFQATFKSGKSQVKLSGTNPQDYPKIANPTDLKFSNVNAREFLRLIECTSFSISADETHLHLSGALLRTKQKRVVMVSTDSRRLTVAHNGTDAIGIDEQEAVIVPLRGVLEIRKALDDAKDTPVGYAQRGANIYIQRPDTMLAVKLIDAQFPDYERVTPKITPRHVAIATRAELTDALKRVSLFANDEHSTVRIELTKNKMTLTATNDKNTSTDELDVEYSGNPIAFGVNAQYLLQAVGQTAGRIQVGLDSEIEPVIVTQEGDTNYIAVIMPVRL